MKKLFSLLSILFISQTANASLKCMDLSGMYEFNPLKDCTQKSYKSMSKSSHYSSNRKLYAKIGSNKKADPQKTYGNIKFTMDHDNHPDLQLEIIQNGCKEIMIKTFGEGLDDQITEHHFEIDKKSIKKNGFKFKYVKSSIFNDFMMLLHEKVVLKINSKDNGNKINIRSKNNDIDMFYFLPFVPIPEIYSRLNCNFTKIY